MYGKGAGRQRPGQPISARFLNRTAMLAEAGAGLTVGPGLTYQTVNGRPLVRALPTQAGSTKTLAIAVTAISVASFDGTTLFAGGGTVRLFGAGSGGEWVITSTDDTAYQVLPGGDPIPAGSILQLATIDGVYVIDAASCTEDTTVAQVGGGGDQGGDTGTGGDPSDAFPGGGGPDSEQESIEGGWNGILGPMAGFSDTATASGPEGTAGTGTGT
jgi:hypothetical protein